ncbi:MAG: DMT family transporter [Gammaproteobacteria bacterium]|nr:DMT family transporter [Gammaproteobacteria bacterium]
MAETQHNQVAGFLLSLTAAALWGLLPIALKEVITIMDAATVVWYRLMVAAVVLGVWLGVRGKWPPLLKMPKSECWILFIAALSLCGNYYYFSLSLIYVNAETSEAVIQLTTLLLILGGVVFYKEPFAKVQKIGTGLILLGLLLFFNDRLDTFVSLDNQETMGVLIVVAAAVMWTVYALLQKRLLTHFSSQQILFFIFFVSSVLLVPFITPLEVQRLSSWQWLLLVFCCFNTLIAYGSFSEAMNLWDASKVSATLALAPLFTIGALKVIVFFNPGYSFSDRLSLLSMLGALLLIIGSVLTALMPSFTHREAIHKEVNGSGEHNQVTTV